MTRIEDYIKTITTFEFKIFDGKVNGQDYCYDSTPEQCMLYVWKKYPSAVFKKMTVFYIAKGAMGHIDPKIFKDIKNIYALGHDEDMNIKTKKDAEILLASFKKKHNIE